MKELETVDFNDLELEEIERTISDFPFPVISVCQYVLYGNKPFSDLVKDFNYFRLYTTPEYVIIEPVSSGVYDNVYRSKNQENTFSLTIPSALKEKKIQKGYYKVYKCKKGFAIKRYERMAMQVA